MRSKHKLIIAIMVASLIIVAAVWWIFVQQSSETNLKDSYHPYPSVEITNYSDTRTLNGDVVDFSRCIPDRMTYPRVFGSDNTEILGIRDGKCVVKFGGETENPAYDGRFFKVCLVSTDLSIKHKFTGNNKSEIAEYCKEI